MDWLKMLAIAGMNGGGSGGSGGGVSPEEVTTIVKEQFPCGVGYTEYEEVYENPLVWNGEAEGHVFVDMPGANGEAGYVKISDTVPTAEDFSNGAVLEVAANGHFQTIDITSNKVGEMYGVLMVADAIMVVPEAVAGKPVSDEFPLIFPESGMYTVWQKSGGIAYLELSVNDYEGFRFRKPIAHKVNEAFLPNKSVPVVGYIDFIGSSGGWYRLTTDGADFFTLKKAIENGNPVFLQSVIWPKGLLRYVYTLQITENDGTSGEAAVFMGLVGYGNGLTDTPVVEMVYLRLNGNRMGKSTTECFYVDNELIFAEGKHNTIRSKNTFYGKASFGGGFELRSSTSGSSKWFNITVDDNGTITATEAI